MATSIIRISNIVLAALLAGIASDAAKAATVAGPHANEEFCKTLVRQVELSGEYMKDQALIPDMTKRAKYFNDQKALNATLVKTASGVALFTRNGNAMYDAQLVGKAGDPARIKTATGPMRSPEQLEASKHMTEYCGAKL